MLVTEIGKHLTGDGGEDHASGEVLDRAGELHPGLPERRPRRTDHRGTEGEADQPGCVGDGTHRGGTVRRSGDPRARTTLDI